MLAVLVIALFLLGSLAGCLISFCAGRLPLEKSVIWPGSRCSNCLTPVSLTDLLPLIGYWRTQGQCRTCGVRFSPRTLVLEVATGILFPLLYYLVVILDIHGFSFLHQPGMADHPAWLPGWQAWAVWLHHAILLCLLLTATVCDLDHREIPLAITVPGTIAGLMFAVLLPWPWPQVAGTGFSLATGPNPHTVQGLYPWPFWWPLPAWFGPGNNIQTGLVIGIAGALAGTAFLRVIRSVFTWGLGIEALGLGDADLMMMAGAFMGWQPVVVAFVIGVFIGLGFGVGQLVLRGDNMIPFGPSLALGIACTALGWAWVAPRVEDLFFNGFLLVTLAILLTVLMFASSYILGMIRGYDTDETRDNSADGASSTGPILETRPDTPLPESKREAIVIVDYGMGNLRSVQKALEKVGYAAAISRDPETVARAAKVILPGVGAFADAIRCLRESGLAEPIVAHIRAGRPFLGICLGYQMLFTRSFEDGEHAGLDVFPGEVRRFPHTPGLKVPHMGWNQLRVIRRAPIFEAFPEGGAVYFVHSYFVAPKDASIVAAETDYGGAFAAAIWRDNVFATQFHPEKSQSLGLEMLRRFASLG